MPRLLCVFRVRQSLQGRKWGATGGLLKKIAFAENVLPSAAPPLLPLFHGTESNTPPAASVEATTELELSMCECE